MRHTAIALAILAMSLGRTADAAERTFCNSYESGSQVVLMIIDHTSAAHLQQQKNDVNEAFTALLGKLTADERSHGQKKIDGGSLLSGQRLDISVVSDSVATRKHLYSECRPGREGGFKSLTERPLNPTTVAQQEEVFWTEARKVVDAEMKRPQSSHQSAIIDTLSSVTGTYKPGEIRRIVVVSDMLDNVTVDTLLPGKGKDPVGMTDFQLQDALRRVAMNRAFSSLKGAAVEVYGFGFNDRDRSPLPVNARKMLEQFWKAYFYKSGESTIAFKY